MEKGKVTLFRITAYDEEKGEMVEANWEMMTKALKSFYSTHPIAIISSVGQPKSGKTTILNSFIDYCTNLRTGWRKWDPVSKFGSRPDSQQSDGIYAVCLPFSSQVNFKRPLGIIFLDIAYGGNNPRFYDHCVNFCLEVSSLVLFTYGPETLKGTVWNESASIAARKKSTKLKIAVVVFAGIKMGAPEVGYVSDDVQDFFTQGGTSMANEGENSLPEGKVASIYDIAVKIFVAVLPATPKLYSADSDSDCQDKLFNMIFKLLEPLRIGDGQYEYCNHSSISQVFGNSLKVTLSCKKVSDAPENCGCVNAVSIKSEGRSKNELSESDSVNIEEQKEPQGLQPNPSHITDVAKKKPLSSNQSLYPHLPKKNQLQIAKHEQPNSSPITDAAEKTLFSSHKLLYPDLTKENQLQIAKSENPVGWELTNHEGQAHCSRYSVSFPKAETAFTAHFDINSNTSKDFNPEGQPSDSQGTGGHQLQNLLGRVKEKTFMTLKMAQMELRKQFMAVVLHMACSWISASKIVEYEAANNEWLVKMEEITLRLPKDSQPSFSTNFRSLLSDLFDGNEYLIKIKMKLEEISKSDPCVEENALHGSIGRIKKETTYTLSTDEGQKILGGLLEATTNSICSGIVKQNTANTQLEKCLVKQAQSHALSRYRHEMDDLLSTSVFSDSDFNNLNNKVSEQIIKGFRYQDSFIYSYMWDTETEALKAAMVAESDIYRRKNQRKLIQIRKEIGSTLKTCLKLYDENFLGVRGANVSPAIVKAKHIQAKKVSLQKMNELLATTQATSVYIREAVQNAISNQIKRFAQQRGFDVILLGDKKSVVLCLQRSVVTLAWDDGGIQTLCVEPELQIYNGKTVINLRNSANGVSSRSSSFGEGWNILEVMKFGATFGTLQKFKNIGHNCTHAEQILALYFELLQSVLMQRRQIFIIECVVVIPEDTTFLAKHRLKTALNLSGLQNNFLMYSTGAVAVSYLQGMMNIRPLNGMHEIIIIIGSHDSCAFGAFKVDENSASMTRIISTSLQSLNDVKVVCGEIESDEADISGLKHVILIEASARSGLMKDVKSELRNRGVRFTSIACSDSIPLFQGALALMSSRSAIPTVPHIQYAEASPYTLVLEAVLNEATMVKQNQLLKESITTTKELWYLEPQKIKILDYTASPRVPVPQKLVAFHCKIPQNQVKGDVLFSVTISPEGVLSNIQAKYVRNGENVPFETRSALIPFESEELAAAVDAASKRHELELTRYLSDDKIEYVTTNTTDDDAKMEWADAVETVIQSEDVREASCNSSQDGPGGSSLEQLENLVTTLEEKLVKAAGPVAQMARKRIPAIRAAIASGNMPEKAITTSIDSLSAIINKL